MRTEKTNGSGRKWARFWLIVALLVSVIANITHTVLAESAISLWLRVPGAVVWPLFTFAGIEIMVRVIWERRWTHGVARSVLLAAAIPAAITSYEHQYTLLGMMGERPLIQFIGPLAIDGLMIGCTMTLLFTRTLFSQQSESTERVPAELSDEALEEIVNRWTAGEGATLPPRVSSEEMAYAEQWAAEIEAIESAPVSPAPAGERKQRTKQSELESAVRLLLAGHSAREASEMSGVPLGTVSRYNTAQRALHNNPMTDDFGSATGKVRPEFIAIMRDHANRERVL